MKPPCLLLVGQLNGGEFRLVFDSLAHLHCIHAADPDAAHRILDQRDPPPDLVAFAQTWPGQIPLHAIEALRRRLPLAPVVALLGAWCEGETRSGTAWPGVVRVYWHQWAARYSQESAWLACQRCSTWGLPATAGEDERTLWTSTLPHENQSGLVTIHTADADMADLLASALQSRGMSAVRCPADGKLSARGVARVIWDCAGVFDGSQADSLRAVSTRYPGARSVALIGFPRSDDFVRAHAAGASAVLSKPLVLADLYWHLGRPPG